MASGDLPDIITLPGAGDLQRSLVDFRQLAEGGFLHDMTDIWEEYATPMNKEVTGADGEGIYNAVKYDGKLMAIPGPRAGLDFYRYFWIREDWLKNLKLEAPTSPEELLEIARAFTHDDPDNNGKDDTFALLADKGLWGRLEGFFWAFGAYPDTWLKDGGGGLHYGAVQSEIKPALRALAAMYADGQLDREFPVKDAAKAQESFATNNVGMAFGGHWDPVYSVKGWENDSNIDWLCYNLPGPGGKVPRGELELGVHNIYPVNKKNKNPEALVKTLNMYWEMLYGETGDYEYWGNDQIDGIWWLGPYAAYHPWVNIQPFHDIQAVYAGTKKPEDLKGVSLDYYNNTENAQSPSGTWTWRKMFTGPKTPFAHIVKIIEEGNLFIDNFAAAPTTTMVDRWSTLLELQDTTFTRIIVGEIDAEQGFDEFVKSWMELGGEKITDEVSDWYRSNIGS